MHGVVSPLGFMQYTICVCAKVTKTSPMNTLDQGRFGGERTESPEFLILTASKISRLLSGMRKSMLSENPTAMSHTDGYSDFLKERLFGLSNPQGNHGESIKEAHFHLDNTPSVRFIHFRYTTQLIMHYSIHI